MLNHFDSLARDKYFTVHTLSSKGSVLIGVVVTMVVMGALGAGMASLIGSSSFHEVYANHGEKAYYLAESGFHFAASTVKSNGNDAVGLLDGQSFSIPSGGDFSLEVSNISEDEGYDNQATTISQIVDPDGEETGSTTYLALQETPNLPRRYGAFRHNGSWYRYRGFKIDEGVATIFKIMGLDTKRSVDGDSTIDSDGNLPLKSGPTVANTNGTFKYDDKEYKYAEYSSGELKTITSDDPNVSFPVSFPDNAKLSFPSKLPMVTADGDEIVLAPILQVKSAGHYPGSGTGILTATRRVTYTWPGALPSQTATPDDFGPDPDEVWGVNEGWDMDDWEEGVKPMGGYTIDQTENALYLEEMSPGNAQPSTMLLFSPPEPIFLKSYEAQIKIKFADDLKTQAYDNPPHYVAGITFRKQSDTVNPGNTESYGVSFLRGHEDVDLLPDELIPGNDTPYVVFWRFDSNPNTPNPTTLLAYASLNDIFDNDGLISPWATLLVRVEQLEHESGDESNRIMAMYSNNGYDENNGNAYPLDDTRIGSPRDGLIDDDGETRYLPWPRKNLTDWVPEKDHFTVVEWALAPNSNASIENGDVFEAQNPETPTSKPVYVRTAAGEYLYSESVYLEVGVHTWGHNMEKNVWFDDFGIKVITDDDGGGIPEEYPEIPPIQS
jgi:hypothetical protein